MRAILKYAPHLTTGIAILCLPLCSYAERFAPDTKKTELIAKAFAPWDKVTRWRIEFESTPSAADRIPGAAVHRATAVASPGEFWETSWHFSRDIPWRMDPDSQELSIHLGKACFQWPSKRAYSEGTLKKGQDLPGSAPASISFSIIPKWLLTDYKIATDPSGAPVTLLDALELPEFRLLSESETISGEECVVFEKANRERIWLASHKGFCLMRRDFCPARATELFSRILVEKMGEAGPGLWIPTEFRRQVFLADTNNQSETLEQESHVRVINCSINDQVSDATFIATYPPGSLRYDSSGHSVQVSAGGEDLLSNTVAFMVDCAHMPSKTDSWGRPGRWFLGGLLIALGTGYFLLAVKSAGASRARQPILDVTAKQ